MFVGLNQVYLQSLQSNTHNIYKYIIKTKWKYYWKLFTTESVATSKDGLGLR